MGHEPRVALLSFSTYGNPLRERGLRVREAIEILDSRGLDFEYDGEIAADVALNEALRELYPFLPAFRPGECAGDAGAAQRQYLDQIVAGARRRHAGGALADGDGEAGADRPAGATVSDIVNFATFAAHEAIRNRARVHSG